MMSANAFKIVLRFSSLYFDEPCPCQRKTQYTPDTQAPARGHTRHPSLSTWAHPIPKPQHAGTPATQAHSTRAHPSPKPSARVHTRYPSPQHAGTPDTQAPARGHTRHPSPSTRAHPTPKPQHVGTPVTQAPARGHTHALILPPSSLSHRSNIPPFFAPRSSPLFLLSMTSGMCHPEPHFFICHLEP